jgi:hypothetical protein
MEKSLFYEEKSLVGLTPGFLFFIIGELKLAQTYKKMYE